MAKNFMMHSAKEVCAEPLWGFNPTCPPRYFRLLQTQTVLPEFAVAMSGALAKAVCHPIVSAKYQVNSVSDWPGSISTGLKFTYNNHESLRDRLARTAQDVH